MDELWSFAGFKNNTLWLWAALCRRTRQIVAWTLGDRSQKSALRLRENIPAPYRRRATRSDLWPAYGAVFPARTHRACGKEQGQTNHIERWFCTLRQSVGRLVRRTLSFSRCPQRHEEAIRLFITEYNLNILRQQSV